MTISTLPKPSVVAWDSGHCVVFKSWDRCVKQNQQTSNEITTEEEMTFQKNTNQGIKTCGETCLNCKKKTFKKSQLRILTLLRELYWKELIHFSETSLRIQPVTRNNVTFHQQSPCWRKFVQSSCLCAFSSRSRSRFKALWVPWPDND